MEAVQGYLTADGTFFSHKSDARLHEAIKEITLLCESHKPQPIQPERFLALLNAWGPQIREFIDANENAKKLGSSQALQDTSTSSGDTTDDFDGNAHDETVEQLKVGGHDDLPDVGNSTRIESVQQRRKKHGA